MVNTLRQECTSTDGGLCTMGSVGGGSVISVTQFHYRLSPSLAPSLSFNSILQVAQLSLMRSVFLAARLNVGVQVMGARGGLGLGLQ